MKIIALILLVSLAGLQPALAKKSALNRQAAVKKNSTKKSSSPLDASKVSSKLVRNELKKELPKFICALESETIRCHRISRNKCLKLIKKELSACLKSNKLKRVISSMESMKYSQAIGLCLKGKVEPQIKKYKKECTIVKK